MRYYKLIISLFFFQSAWSIPVVITGSVINGNDSTPQVLQFYFCNPLNDLSQSVQIEKDHSFRVKEDMIYSQNMTINYNNSFINLYVEPGDSIHLTIDASLLDQSGFGWLRIQGKNALMREQLNRCVDYLYKIANTQGSPYDYTKTPEEILGTVKINYAQLMDSLHVYAKNQNLEQKVIQWAEWDLKYLIANAISDYLHEKVSETHLTDCKKLFFDPFFDVYNEKGFMTMMFPYHLQVCMALLTQSITKDLDSKKTEDSLKIKEGLKILSQEPATPSRSYMIYAFLTRFIKNNPTCMDSFSSSEIEALFTSPLFAVYLNNYIERLKNPTYPQTILKGVYHLTGNEIKQLPSLDLMNHLAKLYPNKVIYVDVYATWCGPCRKELGLSHEIHHLFQGKEVVFVNLCLQSFMNKWKDLVNEYQMEGDNYYLDSDATKLFMSAYGLSGFPGYLLIDKQGKIRSNKAPRPSEKDKLEYRVNELL